jgi:ABC-type glycerol-3-phosphate transport system substrate-binding protein
VACIIAGLFTGCGKEEVVQVDDTPPESKGKNEYGWDIPVNTTEFSYYVKGKGNPDKAKKNSAQMQKYMLDNFNVKIDKIVYDTDGDERLNLMLSSGEYPEVITNMSKTDVDKWKEQGKIIDLTPYVDKVGKDIKKELGKDYGRYLDDDKKIYGLPYGWGMLPIPDTSAHIRWDWYQQMGSPKFETPEEYYEILKQMVAAHPKNAKGEKVYALSWNENCSIDTVAGIWGLKEGYKEDADHNLTHWINTPEGLEFTKFYNQVYRDGMLDPDAFSNKYDEWKAKFAGERIAGHIGGWWESWNAGHEIWQKENKDWKEEQRYVQVKIKAANAPAAYLSPKDTTGWGYTVITDKCKNPEDLMRFFNFNITPTGTRLMAWGIPNEENSNWNFQDGKWSYSEKAKDGIINGTYDYDAHYLLGPNQFWFCHPQGVMSDDESANAWIDQCFNNDAKWKKLMNDNLKDTIYDSSALDQIFPEFDDPIKVKMQQVYDTAQTYWAKAVLSKTEGEFDKNYEQLKSMLDKAGVNEVQEYISKEYKKNLEKLSK